MLQVITGRKLDQTQRFLENGMRIPVTRVQMVDTIVTNHRTPEKNGYWAIQIGVGQKKRATKAEMGQIKGAKLEKAPLFLQEIRVDAVATADDLPKIGDKVQVSDVLKEGDIVNITGTSKGKGFAGGVKRYHFRGGPRTRGQSDRERAPGSIGQGTTPGRVYRGKKMAGNMGNEQVTVKNLEIVGVDGDLILIKGLVPGVLGKSFITIKKVGEMKKFVPLYEEVAKVAEVSSVSKEDKEATEQVQEKTEEPVEVKVKEAAVEEKVQEEPKVEEKKEEAEKTA